MVTTRSKMIRPWTALVVISALVYALGSYTGYAQDCSQEEPEVPNGRGAVGPDNSTAVRNAVDQWQVMGMPVARITAGNVCGTGFLVCEDCLVTCAHVVQAKPAARLRQPIWLWFAYEDGERPYESHRKCEREPDSACVQPDRWDVAVENGRMVVQILSDADHWDVALVKVATKWLDLTGNGVKQEVHVGDVYGTLDVRSSGVTKGETVHVLHHPKGGCQECSSDNEAVITGIDDVNCKGKGWFCHSADVWHGSSGSPVFGAEGLVIGMNVVKQRAGGAVKIDKIMDLEAEHNIDWCCFYSGYPGSEYVLVDLGTLGGHSSLAFGVNQASQTVGGSDADGPTDYPFIYDGCRLHKLPLPPGAYGHAFGIDKSAQVVGYTCIADQLPAAAIWKQASSGQWARTELAPLVAGDEAQAEAIDEEGRFIVGCARPVNSAANVRHAVRWMKFDNWGPALDLGTLGGANSHAHDVVQVGDRPCIVGWSDTATAGEKRGFVRMYGDMRPLRTLRDDQKGNSIARAVNELLHVVGSATNNDKRTQAALWERASGDWRITGLPGLGSDCRSSVAEDINGKGNVVVGEADGRAVRWTRTSPGGQWKVVDLDTRINDSAWRLICAEAINDQGRIVGIGVTNDTVRAFLLVPFRRATPDGSP